MVCPEHVFDVRRIETADYERMGPLQKLKLRVHGMKVAYTPNADAGYSGERDRAFRSIVTAAH